MDELDLPIFKKSYDLYKTFYSYRASVAKQDRYTIWQKCESLLLDVVEGILLAGQVKREQKTVVLEKISLKVNVLRVFFRLAKDIRAIDLKKYAILEQSLDEIGRMLGGWIKSSRETL